MDFEFDGKHYNVEIIKKINTKNTYIRVKDDLTIYVTTNKFITNRKIAEIIAENQIQIRKMIEKIEKKNEYNENFYFLGKKYDLVYINENKIAFGSEKVFIGKDINLDLFLKKEAQKLFLERLNIIYSNFSCKIPYPSLTIRKMKSRWGVCNTKTKRVTLNLELIKKDVSCLDYVIVHELSHLIHPNHSKDFWALVEINYPNYKNIRKLMKEY